MLKMANDIVENNPELNYLAQYILYRYLRRAYLLEPERHKGKIKSTYALLMRTDPWDMDILVDGYLTIANELSDETRRLYQDQLRHAYSHEVTSVNEGAEKLAKARKDMGDDFDAGPYIMFAKNLEHRGNSHRYAAKVLPSILQ